MLIYLRHSRETSCLLVIVRLLLTISCRVVPRKLVPVKYLVSHIHEQLVVSFTIGLGVHRRLGLLELLHRVSLFQELRFSDLVLLLERG